MNDVSVTLEKGKVTAIVGPSGAGKSTLVDLITMLRKPVVGNLYVGGENLNKDNEVNWRNEVAVIHSRGIYLKEQLLRTGPYLTPIIQKMKLFLL